MEQKIKDPVYSIVKSYCQTENELIAVRKEALAGKFFDLNKGIITHLHLVKKCLTNSDDDEFLVVNDTAFICIHHIAIDALSGSQFFLELSSAYNNNSDNMNVVERFRYIDYSIHERILINNTSNLQVTETLQFWSNLLQKYSLNSDIFSDVHVDQKEDDETSVWPLQYFTFEFPLHQTVKEHMLTFCREHNFSLFQLGLTLYYVFLFKLTQHTDLCILCLDANRYRPELESIIGFFVNYLPYRLYLDPTKSFFSLLTEVRALTVQIMEHSYLPYQAIVQQHRNETQQQLQQFLTHLSFELLMSFETEIELDTVRMDLRYVTDSQPPLAKQTDRKHFYFTYTAESSSAGDYWQQTMSQCFVPFLNQLFATEISAALLSQPVYELSLLINDCLQETISLKYFRTCLKGQRIDAREIERTIYESAGHGIINCFVGKVTDNDDEAVEEEYLVAFIHVDGNCDISKLEIQIGEHCERHLPAFMIPSYIVPLQNEFPKDKMLLFEELSAGRCQKISIKTYCIKPVTVLERTVHGLWCEVLQLEDDISMSANFFTIGGNSLLLLKLWYLYQSEFGISGDTMKTNSYFVRLYKRSTLKEHVDLINGILVLRDRERTRNSNSPTYNDEGHIFNESK